MRLETARLVIRTFEPGDGEAWIALVNDPEVTRYTPSSDHRTLEDFQRALELRHSLERERGFAMWAVDAKETATFIGQCGMYLAEGNGPEIELAYHYAPSAWNMGYGTEAATAVLAYAFGAGNLDRVLDRVIALVMPENTGSWRVLEKAGMRFEGTATYYDIPDLKKYAAERAWWSMPPG